MEIGKIIKDWNGKYAGRKIVFGALCGSHNYGTNDETSDYDFKIFVMPSLDDLYSGKKFNANIKLKGNDIEIHDIRKLAEMWVKVNQTYLELLESKDIYVSQDFQNVYGWIQNNKYDIAKSDMKKLYKAMTGMANEKMHAIIRDLPNSQENEGYKRKMLYGFDTKQYLHVVRLMAMRDTIFIWEKNILNTYDLDKAQQWHSPLSGIKDKLLNIKKNIPAITKEQAIVECERLIKEDYDIDLEQYEVNTKIHEKLREKIKSYIIKNIKE